jgi:Rrf2 family protein
MIGSFSRRADYAIRAAVALAAADGSMKRRELAEATGAPDSVLAQALADLARAGVVAARAGPAGGYRLARPANEVSLLDVVRAAGDLTAPRRCVLADRFCDDEPCALHARIQAADDAYVDALGTATLASASFAPAPSLSGGSWLD